MMDTPPKVASRIEGICKARGLTTAAMLSLASLDKNTVHRMKSQESMLSADKLACIAQVLDVPTDFLLGAGVFENWELILKHKDSVLGTITHLMSYLSSNLRFGTDDLTLARLVWMFKVDIEENSDGIAGLGVGIVSPFSVNTTDNPPQLVMSGEAAEAAAEFEKLDAKGRRIVWGIIYEQQKRISDIEEFSAVSTSMEVPRGNGNSA